MLIATAMVMAFGLTACAQTNIPEKVKSAFVQKFPGAKSVKWEKENDAEYEAEFKRDGQEMSASFDPEGNWLETEMEIKVKDLPAAVSHTLATEFDGYEVEEAEKIQTPTRSDLYEVEIEKNHDTWEVQITADGAVIKKKQEKDEDSEDED